MKLYELSSCSTKADFNSSLRWGEDLREIKRIMRQFLTEDNEI